MRIPAASACDSCGGSLEKWDYRYNGKHYCRTCYDMDFAPAVCDVCGKQKMVHKALERPVCKICQIKDDPCVRCGRDIIRPGLILENGPVCASCAVYFREPKCCSVCGESKHNVSNRLVQGEKRPVCKGCYEKTLPTCVMCRRKKKAHHYDEQGRAICEACATHTRSCEQCGNEMPAGRGKVCLACSSLNGLARKISFGQSALSAHYSETFESFARWLAERRGGQFASHRLMFYFPYFQDLDVLATRLDRKPKYAEIVETLTVATTRKYLLATRFLEESGVIVVDRKIKEEFANWDMIERYLNTFEQASYFCQMVEGYFDQLKEKLMLGKTSVRSIRLALSPAVRFFDYCQYCDREYPDQEMLAGYLWCYPGQKSAITGFVNFLNQRGKVALSFLDIGKLEFEHPLESREFLRQRMIDLLRRYENTPNVDREELLRTAICYSHGVRIPDQVRVGFCEIKRWNGVDSVIKMAGKNIYLPEEIMKLCSNR